MKLESKSIYVNYNEENDAIKAYEDFGWTILSSERIGNEVKLVFQRDTNQKNYKELKALEEEWDELEKPYFIYIRPKYIEPILKSKVVLIILFFIGIALPLVILTVALPEFLSKGVSSNSGKELIAPIVVIGGFGIFCLITGIIFVIENKKKVRIAQEKYEQAKKAYNNHKQNYENEEKSYKEQLERIFQKLIDLNS